MEIVELGGQKIGKWNVGASTYLALPQHGARLLNWHVKLADGSVRDVIHWPEDANWQNVAKVRGGNPILFPFCARCYDDGDVERWRDAQGRRLPMPRNGIARQGNFTLTESSPTGFTARFQNDTDAAFSAYPFQYTFEVRYRFEELALHVDLSLTNADKDDIPWSAGHHFYFALPWHANLSRSDYRIQLQAKKAFRQADDGSLIDVGVPERETALDDLELIDRCHARFKQPQIQFGPKGGDEDITLWLGGQAAGTPNPWHSLTTWTEADDSPFYCVEPWMGPPNAPGHGKGLHWVRPGQTQIFSTTVSVA